MQPGVQISNSFEQGDACMYVVVVCETVYALPRCYCSTSPLLSILWTTSAVQTRSCRTARETGSSRQAGDSGDRGFPRLQWGGSSSLAAVQVVIYLSARTTAVTSVSSCLCNKLAACFFLFAFLGNKCRDSESQHQEDRRVESRVEHRRHYHFLISSNWTSLGIQPQTIIYEYSRAHQHTLISLEKNFLSLVHP